MFKRHRTFIGLMAALVFSLLLTATPSFSEETPPETTRVTGPDYHKRTGPRSYPYRAWSKYILKQLDLRRGDVVLDIGAGDGWWSERLAKELDGEGKVYALEVEEDKVKEMKEKFADNSLIEPYLGKTDNTLREANSCDLAFISQVYHHLDDGGRVSYLKHLKEVVKPTGRLVVIEKYADVAVNYPGHSTKVSDLTAHAEQSGWILVRYELMKNTNHYLAIFVQKDLFTNEE